MTFQGVPYNTIHQWNLRHWSKTGICEHCNEKKKTQWSNKSGKYYRHKKDWQELCASCHAKYDIRVLKSKRGLHKLTMRNRYGYNKNFKIKVSQLLEDVA